MDSALVIAALWIAFAGSHMALSSRSYRPRIVAALGGERRFQGLYSLIALAIFVPLVAIYFRHKHAGPYLFTLADHVPGLRGLMFIGMGAAFALLVAGLARPSPASVVPGTTQVRGIYHVSRHPVLMSFALYGLLHLCVVSVNATELAFFAGFPLFVAVGARHQDQRKLAANPEFKRFYDATPFVPFSRPAGVVAALREQPVPIAIGIALTVVIRWFHPSLFGPG